MKSSSIIRTYYDIRLKTNIANITGALGKIEKLRGVSFDWRVNDSEVLSHYPLMARFNNSPHSVGLIAQEVQNVLPEAILQETVGDTTTQYLQLDYTKFVPLLVEGVKEMKAENDALKKENRAMKSDIEMLKQEVKVLGNGGE
ncbi:MAG: tail fiber domain-containing protein [Candidatus Aenigmarchaeota archaeon]|nr:tail fiber domain-containing protein [Candidatus Aenigmarchaeota archaeon]